MYNGVLQGGRSGSNINYRASAGGKGGLSGIIRDNQGLSGMIGF